MSSRIKAVTIFASAAAVVGSVVYAPAAYAAGTCSSGMVCVWRDAGETGPKYQWIQGDVDVNFRGETYTNSSSSLNDSITSAINHTNRTVWFYTDSRYCGDSYGVAAGATVHFTSPYQDSLSSMSSNGNLACF